MNWKSLAFVGVWMLFTNWANAQTERIEITWEKNFLTVKGKSLPGEVSIHYLEAYCRPGSTDREWGETVIKHQAELLAIENSGAVIKIRDKLADGVVVHHTITAGVDDVDFQVVANNPTNTASQAHWAQPCMRVDKFTGATKADARELFPQYIKSCFLFVDEKLTMLPTTPWAEKARYIPGQVYCPKHVDRNDVNPRPLSSIVPSNGLTGCFSADRKKVLAMAWEPYQEIFQGVIACMHNDFRIGGLKPGETKTIRGKIYVMDADPDRLLARYRKDFGKP